MRRPALALSLASVGLALASIGLPTSSAGAQAGASQAPRPHVDVGIGEQNLGVFEDPRFHATGIRHARLIVPYDVVRAGGVNLNSTDAWLATAQRHGIEPLVTFAYSASKRQHHKLPTVRQYSARVREFRERHPWVRQYATWNEANHPGIQPTGRHPRRTATFYRALRRQCSGCTVVAVELLLTHSWRTWRWIHHFRKRAGRGPHIWGLHNYPDVTRLRFLNTSLFLRRVRRDEVWFTETGGIVRFERAWPYDERRAARSVRHTFRLAAMSPRIKRIYLYNWRAEAWNRRWDSGFISAEGLERRAFFELLDALRRERFRPPPPPVYPDTPPGGPIPTVDTDD